MAARAIAGLSDRDLYRAARRPQSTTARVIRRAPLHHAARAAEVVRSGEAERRLSAILERNRVNRSNREDPVEHDAGGQASLDPAVRSRNIVRAVADLDAS